MSSTTKITGRVFKVFPKEWPSRFPGKKGNTTYSIKLENDPIYYRTPRAQGGDGERFGNIAEPGNMITFSASPINDTSSQIEGAVTLVETPKAEAAATAPAAAAVKNAMSYADRDSSIQYQSSRKDAIEFVKLTTSLGAIKLPEKPANKLQALEALVDKYTADFYADVSTKGAVIRAAGEEETKDVPAAAKTDEE